MNWLNKLFRRLPWALLMLFGVTPAWALDDPPADVVSDLAARISLGYRGFSTDHEAGRVVSHTAIDAGPTVDLEVKFLDPTRRYMLHGTYLNDSDYLFEGDFDYKGLLRLNFESEKLFHHLDDFAQDQRPRAEGTLNGDNLIMEFTPTRNKQDNYHVEVGIDQVELTAKVPNYPAHLTLGYWRLEREGRKQLQYFSEHPSVPENVPAATNCVVCHLKSETQSFKRVTEEVTLGADAHAGYVTVAVEQLFRRFREKSATPLEDFGSFPYNPAFNLNNGWDAGSYPHDDTPDSRLTATTVKVSTSPSGGLVAAAAFTLGRKENLADLGPYIESVDADTNFTKSCADVTYIPHPKLTLNFRYRMLDQDSNIPSQLTLLQATPQTVPVRESIDLERASYFAKASYRPSNRLTLMAEYERKDIHRSQTGPAAAVQYDPYWELPEDETINRYRISFINRPLGTSKLRINGWYELLTSDDPAYGVSVEDRQQVFAGVNWTPSKTFGLTSNLRLKKGRNSDFQGLAAEIDRSQWEQNFTFGLWAQPVEIVSLALNYGFMNTKIAQDTVYGTAEPNLVYDSHSAYRQRVHTTTLTLSVRLTEKIRVHAEGRHIRSHSKFDPEFSPQIIDPAYGILVDSSGLSDLSELEIIQSGVGLGLDWAINEEWSCSAKFSHDDYEDRHSNAFDGTVQMYMFNIARSW